MRSQDHKRKQGTPSQQNRLDANRILLRPGDKSGFYRVHDFIVSCDAMIVVPCITSCVKKSCKLFYWCERNLFLRDHCFNHLQFTSVMKVLNGVRNGLHLQRRHYLPTYLWAGNGERYVVYMISFNRDRIKQHKS